MLMMSMGKVGMVSRLLMAASIMMFGCFLMVMGCLFVVFSGFAMMFCCLF